MNFEKKKCARAHACVEKNYISMQGHAMYGKQPEISYFCLQYMVALGQHQLFNLKFYWLSNQYSEDGSPKD
jgi:hypothetical protein